MPVAETLLLAAAASCATISNADQRAYCIALERRSESACMVIADHALRTRCRVELGGNDAACWTISDAQARALCVARGKP